MRALIIEANRDGYHPRQCHRTLTVAELQAILEDYPEDMPVYLSHDNGFTYGSIEPENFHDRKFSNDED